MFSQWRQNVKFLYFSSCATNISIYHVLMIMPNILHIFAPYSPWHNLQQFKYNKKLTVYIFFTGLHASCFCTVCPVDLVRVRLKMWMGEDSGCQNASCIYSKENTDIYNQDINYNFLYYYTILTTNIAINKVSYLLYYRTQCKQNTQHVYLSQYLTNLMHKICFTISFISCLYMFRAHVLIIMRSKYVCNWCLQSL